MSEANIERLKSKTTLKEILAVATEFERTARDFYADLAPKVRKNLRYLVGAKHRTGGDPRPVLVPC